MYLYSHTQAEKRRPDCSIGSNVPYLSKSEARAKDGITTAADAFAPLL